jgi:hypothetical protein
MNAEKYLTTKRIWMKPSPEIRNLDGKFILIVDSEESEVPANLSVSEGDPNGANAGKCSVVVRVTRVGKVEWRSASPPTTPTSGCERFLTQDAVDLIRPNDRDPTQGEFILVLPIGLQCLD